MVCQPGKSGRFREVVLSGGSTALIRLLCCGVFPQMLGPAPAYKHKTVTSKRKRSKQLLSSAFYWKKNFLARKLQLNSSLLHLCMFPTVYRTKRPYLIFS